MRIVCPGCAAEYEVPSANLHPRRKVRCARCSTEWIPVQEARTLPPSEPEEPFHYAMAEVALPTETAMDRLAAAPPLRRSGALRAAWVLTVLVLVGSAAAAVTWRNRVTHAWPASAWVLGSTSSPSPAAPHPDTKAEKSPE